MNRFAKYKLWELLQNTCTEPTAVLMLLSILKGKGSELSNLALWLMKRVEGHEQIEVSKWNDDNWYLTVIDKNPIKVETANHAVRMRISFTFNIRTGSIVWFNPYGMRNASKMAFLRDKRWYSLLHAYWNELSTYHPTNNGKKYKMKDIVNIYKFCQVTDYPVR